MLPRIIILHLHRFSFKENKRRELMVEKDDSFVKFPEELDMEK